MSENSGQLLIGTSGYYYPDWRNVFYPPGLPDNKRLVYYTGYFNIVEINATYYKIPAVQTFQRMVKITPPHFRFMVKTHQETTHRRLENEAALHKLTESVEPLIKAAKFAGYLAQFPYSFKNTEQNRKYLLQTKQILKDAPLFVEFRNSTWVKSQLPEFLKANQIGYVNVDQPQIEGLLPSQDIVTTESGYIRFHGRNAADWWEGKGSARYNYDYKEDELTEWLTNISQILRKTFKTYIFFNNHPNGQAVKNAKQMIEILKSKALL